jgi:hypothetical protein
MSLLTLTLRRDFHEILKEGDIIDVFCCPSSPLMCKARKVFLFGAGIQVNCNEPFTPALAAKYKLIVVDTSCDSGCLGDETKAIRPNIQVQWTHPRSLIFLDLGEKKAASFTEGQNIGAEAFSLVYERGTWGADGEGSGAGSTIKYTSGVRAVLKQVLSNSSLGITSMVDAPCGSFHWMPVVLSEFPGIHYTGLDITCSVIEGNVLKHRYNPRLKFYCVDMCHQVIPKVRRQAVL